MGLFVKQITPHNILPVGNPITFSASYTTPSEDGFNWLADIYIAGTKIASLNKQPTYQGSQFFDVSNICKNSLSYDFNPEITAITKSATNSLKRLRVDLGYKTTLSGVTGMSADTGSYWIFNGYLDRNEWLNYNDTDYLPVTGNTEAKFLSKYNERNVKKTDYGTLSLLHGQLTPYWSTWAQIGIVTNDPELFLYIENPYDGNTIDEQRLDIPIYPQNLNDALAGGKVKYWNGTTSVVLTGVTDLFETFSYVKYSATTTLTGGITQYKAHTLASGLKSSKYYTFNLVDDCSKYSIYQVAWLNSLGAFDFISFNGLSSDEYSWERLQYKKRLGSFSQSTYINSYTGKDFEETNFNTLESKIITVNTNWLDDNESARTIELLGSPVVFVNSNDEWVPMNVTMESQMKQTKNNQKMINYTLTFKPTYNQRKQKF